MDTQIILAKIDRLLSELKTLSPLSKENQEKLDRKFRLEFQYNTNHIEGNTLSYAETELLLIFDETRGSHTLREHEEMKGSDVAFKLIKDLAEDKERPLTEAFIKNLNQILLVRPYWKEAITPDGQKTQRKITVGDYKKHPNSVLLENGEIFQYASPNETAALMGELIAWFNEEIIKKEIHPVQLAAILHHKFVLIHPFDDGNGRISRLLLNYVLFVFELPPIIIKSDDKPNYLRSLRDADTGNMDSFIAYLGEQSIWSLELALKSAKNESIDELDDWKKNLNLLKRELDGSDEIKVKKSNKVITELVNEQILPLGKRIEKELTEFSELFLSRFFFFLPSDFYKINFFTEKITDELANTDFNKGLRFIFKLIEFRKKINNPFTIEIEISFSFDDFKYAAYFENQQVFFNLYHQKISENQTKELVSRIASLVLLKIDEKVRET